MSQNITVTRHISAAGVGGSGAQVFADANGEQYYVKYQENGQNLRVLANEYVAGQIAKTNKLLCPDSFLITIDNLLLTTLAPINGHPISSGPHFGSKRMNNLYSGPALRSLIPKCSNISDYAGIILFDAWLYNTDRRNDGNYLILTEGSNYNFCIIDHGHCFGMNWTNVLLQTYLTEWSNAYLDEMYALINGRVDFDAAIDEINLRDDTFISNLVDAIPTQWLSDASESAALKKYLSVKRDDMENLLNTNSAKFPNWA